MMPDAGTVLLVDDHEVVRRGLAEVIDASGDLRVVAETGTVSEGVTAATEYQPDLAVVDVHLPDGTGIEACRLIREASPGTVVVMLTAFADEQAFVAASAAGATGYLLKRIQADELLSSLRRAVAGESLLDPELSAKLSHKVSSADHGDPLLGRLSPQERKVLELIAQGMSNREIAEEIFLAEKTVKNYVSNMLAKLEMSNRSEAAAYASRMDAQSEGAGFAEPGR